ncbi:MAG: winged helix-turn-helix domain-containing protein [Acidobacteriota bacterium]
MNEFYKFFDFTLNPATRRLLIQNEEVAVSSKAFDILSYLVENRGKIVSKDELFQMIWADSFVEENNLPVHISALRRVLGDKRGESRFIKTISGRGYSFIAPVEKSKTPSAALPKNDGSNLVNNSPDKQNSIAVLPFAFENENADLEYLAGGITQSLIESLSQIPNLKVMAYTAVKNYRKSNLDLSEVGFQLSVDKILLGTLTEHKNRLDLSVELINTADRSHLWGTQYNCQVTDVFAVKKEISLVIADKLKLQISRIDESNLSQSQTNDAEAYQFYLKGKYILDNFQSGEDYQESLYSALNFFQQALKRDSNYAPAYVGSGRVYFMLFNDNFLSLAEARQKCQTALQLAFDADRHLSDTFALQGMIQIYFERNWQEAKKSLAHAVRLNPNDSYAFHALSLLLACLGNFDEAIFYQNQALQFDPTSLILNSGLINRFFLAENFRQAIVQAEEALELNPRSVTALALMALSFANLKVFDEAINVIDKVIAAQSLKELLLIKAHIYALAKKENAARETLKSVLTDSDNGRQVDFTDAAAVYSALNDQDKTFEFLEKAFLKGSTNLLCLKVDPRFNKSRGDSRFDALLQKLNLE